MHASQCDASTVKIINPIKFAPVIDNVIDARYLMIKRDPLNILNSFMSLNNLSSRAICRLLKILMPVNVRAEKGMIDTKSTKNAPFK